MGQEFSPAVWNILAAWVLSQLQEKKKRWEKEEVGKNGGRGGNEGHVDVDLNIRGETANLLENTFRVFSWPWDKKSSLKITKVLIRKKLTSHRNHKENDKSSTEGW